MRWNGVSIPQRDWHFHKRLLERYRIVLAPGEYQLIAKATKSGAHVVRDNASKGKIFRVYVPSASRNIYVSAKRGRLFSAWPTQVFNKGDFRKIRQPDSQNSRLTVDENGKVILEFAIDPSA